MLNALYIFADIRLKLYFTPSQSRVNYTGEWVNGEREGNGTTNFRDGAVYRGEYRCRVPRAS